MTLRLNTILKHNFSPHPLIWNNMILIFSGTILMKHCIRSLLQLSYQMDFSLFPWLFFFTGIVLIVKQDAGNMKNKWILTKEMTCKIITFITISQFFWILDMKMLRLLKTRCIVVWLKLNFRSGLEDDDPQEPY